MIRILSIILFCIISLGTVQAHASDTLQNDKQTLAVLIVNNSYSDTRKAMVKQKSQLPDILINQITKSLDTKYKIKQINNDYNISDVASTEKSDLLDMFKETEYSIVMLMEILPVHQSGLYVDTFVEVHFKILNIKDKKYLYNGKLWSEKSFVSSALEDINIPLDKILTNTL